MNHEPDETRPALREAIDAKAHALGFDAVGVARADVPLEGDFARYEAFVDAGMHGTMAYLAENRDARRALDGESVLAGAKSVICLARRYSRDGHDAIAGLGAGLARYARGADYHTVVRKRLRQLAAFVRGLGDGVRARPILDTAPVLERAWAARAGLGFVGKNGLLIVPGQGSYVLLGEVVTTLELAPDVPLRERCGACTRCLDACPTGAFVAPFVLDPRACIAYLTIEHRGAYDETLRGAVGERVFGCDTCQEVCPFNGARPAPPERTTPFAPLARWAELSPERIVAMAVDGASLEPLLEGSPLRRAAAEGLLRNAVTAVANRGDPSALASIARLAEGHADPGVRDHARWALARLRRETP